MVPTVDELADAIRRAARAAFAQLFAERAGERFYYCTLVTTGEALPPVPSAWSHEALEAVARTPARDPRGTRSPELHSVHRPARGEQAARRPRG
ncbi:MAG: DUF4303 domain-containing protein [Sandaracinaceae bacterium]|nr:DUF4303 domain-containing protein [Sandaracinaceae bacterium]